MFLNEELKQFQNKDKGNLTDKQLANQQGEALEVYDLISSSTDLSSFNLFYNNRLNQSYNNNKGKIRSYREMATMPEIGDVIDDAVNESTQEDDDGNVFNLEIVNEKFAKNENISKVLNEEFDELFNNRLDINKEI
jgi:stress-induced morphogen